jgi:hypothetical protein
MYVTTLSTSYLTTTNEHRIDISQNRLDISSNLSKINDISNNRITGIEQDITDISNNRITVIEDDITDISNNRITAIEQDITDISNNRITVLEQDITDIRTTLLFHIISARPPKQPRMVRTFLKVHTRSRLAYALQCRGY